MKKTKALIGDAGATFVNSVSTRNIVMEKLKSSGFGYITLTSQG